MGQWFAILTTNERPQPGTRLLIVMPTETTSPHGVGRIMTVEPRGEFVYEGRRIPSYTLTVAVESYDDAAAKHEFHLHLPLDCYSVLAEAEKWHAVDDEHVIKHGYGRNHWL